MPRFPTEFESVATTGTEALTDAIKHIQPLLGKADPMVFEVTTARSLCAPALTTRAAAAIRSTPTSKATR
ncbi:hypothetical protein K4749_33490 [Streptomyces sp. TRM72054]|uniref:hypothetical protein n=1 Tax=Streptomyces sp. TRM72054 TaxID=2870562 RepID=UPI001C8BF30B|nr:hypothetical protein [Streptomyces sp. TRM72054]MBX9398371.1 hypothetical protein [Streptomyces sp. TRM72054]